MTKVQEIETGVWMRPRAGEIVSGDAGVVAAREGGYFLAIVDVLGHGPEAHSVAERIEGYLRENAGPDLAGLMGRLHERLKGALGAAVGLAYVEAAGGRLRYVGVGNTRIRRFGSAETRLVSRDGTVGWHLPTVREASMTLGSGDLVLLTTDGVSEHFGVEDYPGLLGDSAAVAARLVIHRFGKEHDDATCIALRYRS